MTNAFFDLPPPKDGPKVPERVYARVIERDEDASAYVLFDAIDAKDFDGAEHSIGAGLASPTWRSFMDGAQIYAIEVNGLRPDRSEAALWLKGNAPGSLPDWVEITMEQNLHGPADLYGNILGPSTRVKLNVMPVSPAKELSLTSATDLTPQAKDDNEVSIGMPFGSVDHIVVLDVGQGAAHAMVDAAGSVIAYVDLGSGVLADAGTWPAAMTSLCLVNAPVVILTHWHYDHFEAANRYPAAQALVWIAPLQVLGPGPQSAFASALLSTGTLLTWKGMGAIRKGSVTLERCRGPMNNQNRTGIAVWVEGPAGEDPILLPGDAGYKDINTLPCSITSLVASHHGGYAPGTPPNDPGLPETRVALSYGPKNTYGHPLASSINALTSKSLFKIGHPHAALDERRTEDLRSALGHTGLKWASSSTPAISCGGCGCSVGAMQW